MLTPPATPGAVFFVVIDVGAAALWAAGSQLPRCFFIELLPVIVIPSRTAGHSYSPFLRNIALLYHREVVKLISDFLPLAKELESVLNLESLTGRYIEFIANFCTDY